MDMLHRGSDCLLSQEEEEVEKEEEVPRLTAGHGFTQACRDSNCSCLTMLTKQSEADRTVFVGNLDPSVKEEILYELFLQAGPLIKVNIAKDKEGNFKSFGFVCFKHKESVPYAMALLNGIRLYGRPLNLRYRFGSFFSAESPNHPHGSDNGCVANPLGYRTDVMGDSSAFSPPVPPMDNGYLSQAYLYFHGMMNQFLASPYPANGWMSQEPPYYKPAVQWNADAPLPVYEQPDCAPGPSSADWTPKNLNDLDTYKKTKVTCKRKIKAETCDTGSDSSETTNDNKEARPKYRKRKTKRKRI